MVGCMPPPTYLSLSSALFLFMLQACWCYTLMTRLTHRYQHLLVRRRLPLPSLLDACYFPNWRHFATTSSLSEMSASCEVVPKCYCQRLVVSLKQAFESDRLESQYRRAIQTLNADEYERIPKFRFRDDALACLIGRLLLRQAAMRFTDGYAWHEIVFARTERGKPYLTNPANTTFGLNVSHQGDYVAFASSCTNRVGVDCMRIEKDKSNRTADEYINFMSKSASPTELQSMKSQPTEIAKLTFFYRYWCLKEAIMKATGEGIIKDLGRLDFRVDSSERYRPGVFITSTTVLDDGIPQPQWIFEESFIDQQHSAAVCREKQLPSYCQLSRNTDAKIFFSKVDMEYLLANSQPINVIPFDGSNEWDEFVAKPRKPF